VPAPVPAPTSDVKYVLVDAETNADLEVLSQTGITAVNAMASSKSFNIRVEGNQGVDVTRVNFDGGNNEGKAPFAFCGGAVQ